MDDGTEIDDDEVFQVLSSEEPLYFTFVGSEDSPDHASPSSPDAITFTPTRAFTRSDINQIIQKALPNLSPVPGSPAKSEDFSLASDDDDITEGFEGKKVVMKNLRL